MYTKLRSTWSVSISGTLFPVSGPQLHLNWNLSCLTNDRASGSSSQSKIEAQQNCTTIVNLAEFTK